MKLSPTGITPNYKLMRPFRKYIELIEVQIMEEQQKHVAGFLRQEEMNELIAQEQDPITADLMSQAAYVLVMTVGTQKPDRSLISTCVILWRLFVTL
jgi:hypothetical protein